MYQAFTTIPVVQSVEPVGVVVAAIEIGAPPPVGPSELIAEVSAARDVAGTGIELTGTVVPSVGVLVLKICRNRHSHWGYKDRSRNNGRCCW